MAKFHLGCFTTKAPHKSPKYSIFPTFYEGVWDLRGAFLGDQPKWKSSSGTCNYVCVNCMSHWKATHKPSPKHQKFLVLTKQPVSILASCLRKGLQIYKFTKICVSLSQSSTYPSLHPRKYTTISVLVLCPPADLNMSSKIMWWMVCQLDLDSTSSRF